MYYYIINIEGLSYLFTKRVRLSNRSMARKFSTVARARAYFKNSDFKALPFTIEKIVNTKVTDPDYGKYEL